MQLMSDQEAPSSGHAPLKTACGPPPQKSAARGVTFYRKVSACGAIGSATDLELRSSFGFEAKRRRYRVAFLIESGYSTPLQFNFTAVSNLCFDRSCYGRERQAVVRISMQKEADYLRVKCQVMTSLGTRIKGAS